MVKDTLIELPVKCINCGYPEQYGAKINAQIYCNPKEEIVRRSWKCPICGANKSIEIQMTLFKEKIVSRFPLGPKNKGSEELEPGRVSKMEDD